MTQPFTPTSFSDAATQAFGVAPGLAQAPSVISDIASQAGDVTANAQVTDLAAQRNALGQAAQTAKRGGWWGDIVGVLHTVHKGLNAIPGEKSFERDVISPVAHTIGGPLREVQHEYRMIHDVYTRDGVMAGLGASILPLVGAGIGAYVGGGQGLALGAEVGGETDRFVPHFQQAYDRTSDGANYRDIHGNTVSFGRDLAGAIFRDRSSEKFKLLSGTLDAAADYFADPLINAGGLYKGYRAGETNTAMELGRAEQIIAKAHTGVGPGTGVGNSFKWLADQKNAGTIISRYPTLAPLAGDLAKAKDSVEVGEVFLSRMRQGAMLGQWNGIFPSRTALFGTVGDWRQAIKESGQTGLQGQNLNAMSAADVAQATQGSVLSRLYQIVGNKQPTAVDAETGKLSNRVFDPLDPKANLGVFRAARRVYGEKAAQDFMDLWTHAQDESNLGALKTLWQNANTHLFIRDGVTDDGLLRVLQDKAKMLTHTPGEDTLGTYMRDIDGKDISSVTLGGDRTVQVGALESHVGRFSFPDFGQLHNAVAALKNAQIAVPGGIAGDAAHLADHLANHALVNNYVDKVFKPLAIGTSASGLRVGLSEVLTYGLKDGFGSYLKALSGAMKAKEDAYQEALSKPLPTKTVTVPHPDIPGDTLTTSVPDPAAAAKRTMDSLWHASGARATLAKLAPVLNRNDPEMAKTFARLAADGGLRNVAGHGSSALHTIGGDVSSAADELVGDLRNQLPRNKRLGHGMTVFHQSEADQPFAHRAALNEFLDPTGQAAMTGLKDGLRTQGLTFGDALTEAQRATVLSRSAAHVEAYLRSPESEPFRRKMLRNEHTADPDRPGDGISQWAYDVARGLEGVTAYRNPEGLVVHNPVFAEPLSKGELPTIGQLQNNPILQRPVLVKGREIVEGAMGGGLQRLVNGTFEKFFAPWVNNLSREPLYGAAVHDLYTKNVKLFGGAVDDDLLWAAAKNHAVTEIMPMLHNPMEKTQLEYAVKNIFPFMFAQRQQYSRYAKALINNPAGFRKAQLAQTGLRSAGFIQKDANGQDTFIYPGAGHVNASIAAGLSVLGVTPTALIPTGLTGQVQSLNPGAGALYPGVSPVIAIPMTELGKLFPNEIGSITDKAFAKSAQTPLWAQVLPFSPLKNAVRAYGGEHDKQFANSLMSVIAAAKSHDDKILAAHPGEDPLKVKGLILPPDGATPKQQQDAMNHLRNWTRVHYAFMAAFGFFAPAAPQTTYGDQKIQKTLRALANSGDGTQSTLEKINAYVAAHPEALPYTVYKTHGLAGFSIPPAQAAVDWVAQNHDFLTNHTYAAAALTPQLNDHNPDAQALFSQQVQTGVRSYKSPEAYLTDLYVKEAATPYFAAKKIHDDLMAANKGNPAAMKQEKAQWAQAQSAFFVAHPVFQQWVTSPDRELQRQQIIRDLQSVFYGPQGDIAPDSPMKAGVKMLLDAYTQHEAMQTMLTGTGSADRKQADDKNWSDYLDSVQTQQPQLAGVISHVFRYIKPDTVADRPLLNSLGLVPAGAS